MAEFKRRCGFEQKRVPRYFVPLTTKGRLALNLDFFTIPPVEPGKSMILVDGYAFRGDVRSLDAHDS